MAHHVSLDLNSIHRIAVLATDRTAAFLALGLRAADQEPPSSLALGGASIIRILPEPLPPELARSILAEWRGWVVGAALRELDGIYALFLERAFEAVLMIDAHGSKFGEDRQRDLKVFTGKNTRDRLATLSVRLASASAVAGHFHSVTKARNILTHNAGIVRAADCGSHTAFELTWVGMDVVIVGAHEQTEHFRYRGDSAFTPRTLPEPSQVNLEFVERSRRFEIGQLVATSPHDLHEICMMYRREADPVVTAMAAFASAHSVPVAPPSISPD